MKGTVLALKNSAGGSSSFSECETSKPHLDQLAAAIPDQQALSRHD
jgi:hypothetical protein